jgi:hypothetical protein
VNVTVFESRDYVGGRLHQVEIGGKMVNVGGDAWSSVNPLVKVLPSSLLSSSLSTIFLFSFLTISPFLLQKIVKDLNVPLSNSSNYAGNGLVAFWTTEGWLSLGKDIKKHILDDLMLFAEIELVKARLLEVRSLPSSSSSFPSSFSRHSSFSHSSVQSYAERILTSGEKFDTVSEYVSWGLSSYINTTMSSYLSSSGVSSSSQLNLGTRWEITSLFLLVLPLPLPFLLLLLPFPFYSLPHFLFSSPILSATSH